MTLLCLARKVCELTKTLARESFVTAAPSMNYLRVASAVADGETVTIGSTVFEVDTNATYTAGRIPVTVVGTTAAEFTTAFTAAVNNAGLGFTATRTDANSVIVADPNGSATATTETLAGANNAWSTATLAGGTTPGASRETVVVSRVPTAQEVTVQIMVFPLNFTPTAANVTVRTSAGVYRAWDGAITISGQNVIVASSGSVDVAAADIVTVTAQ